MVWVRLVIIIVCEVKSAVMAENILLDGLVHIPTKGQKVFWAVFILGHLLDPRPVSLKSFLVSQVTLYLLPFLLLLPQFLIGCL